MQTVDVPFLRGLNEDTSSKVLSLPELVRCENLLVDRGASIRKRPGVTDLAASATGITDPRKLIRYGSELLLCDAESLYSYSSTDDDWRQVEDTGSLSLTRRDAMHVPPQGNVVGSAAGATALLDVRAWVVESDGPTLALYVSVATTGRTKAVRAGLVPSGGPNAILAPYVKAVAVGDVVFVVFGDGGVNQLKFIRVTSADVGAWESGDVTNITTGVQGQYDSAPGTPKPSWMDACEHDGRLVVAWATSTPSLEIASYNEDGTAEVTATTIASGDQDYRVGLAGNVGSELRVHIMHSAGSSAEHDLVRLTGDSLTSAGSGFTEGPGTIFDPLYGFAVERYSDTLSVVVRGHDGYSRIITYSSASGVDQSDQMLGLVPVSKPWVRGERVYMAARNHEDLASNYTTIVSMEPGDTLFSAMRAEMMLLGARTNDDPPANIATTIGNPSAGVYVVPLLSYERAVDPAQLAQASGVEDPALAALSYTELVRQRIEVIRADAYVLSHVDPRTFQSAELGGSLYLAGGQVMQYDGERLTELGFYAPPAFATPTVSTPGGTANMAAGWYVYALVWEWYDGRGNRHQSAPSLQVVEVVSDNSQVSITIPSLQVSRKHWRLGGGDGRDIVCAVYRSEVQASIAIDAPPPVLHRLEGGTAQAFVVNDPTAGTSGTYVDTRADDDVTLGAREILYSGTGGANELDNFPPPPSNVIIAHQDRLVGDVAEDPSRLWYSKSIRNGAGIAWSEALQIALEEPATALAKQDGNLIVFSRRSVFTIVGQGADNTGGSTNYEPPQRLSSETGCIEPRSVVNAPPGIFFQSEQGLMLMERGGFTAQRDPRVTQTLASYPVITGAVHVIDHSRVAFACAASESATADSRLLVYDYEAGFWSVYDYGDGFQIRDLALDDGRIVWTSTGTTGAGLVTAREDYATGADTIAGADPVHVDWLLETGDMRLDGLSSRGRVRSATVVGRTMGQHRLCVQESYDSGESFEPGFTWNVNPQQETQRQYRLRYPKAWGFRFRLSGTASFDLQSLGPELNGLTLEYRTMRGTRRLSAAERGG